MATVEADSSTQHIGAVAGQVWHLLDSTGPQKITHVVKEVDVPRDLVMQAIGWLAREEKVVIEEQSRSRVLSLAD